MKAHPRFASLSFDDWHAKVSKTLQEAGDNADSRAKADDMYYHYYKIFHLHESLSFVLFFLLKKHLIHFEL